MKKLIIIFTIFLSSCSDDKKTVDSPFSKLDKVQKKTEEPKEEKDGSSIKSPFSNIKK